MEVEYNEYVTFHVTATDGRELEMAVVDEFDFEKKHYIVAAIVEDDVIQGDAYFIYKAIINGDDFVVEQIRNEIDYQRIANAYLEMED